MFYTVSCDVNTILLGIEKYKITFNRYSLTYKQIPNKQISLTGYCNAQTYVIQPFQPLFAICSTINKKLSLSRLKVSKFKNPKVFESRTI
jgi:hypothetical protein